MGLVPALNTFVPGTPIVASAMNANFSNIVTAVNGQLNDVNIQQISAEKVTSGEFDPDRIPQLSLTHIPRLTEDKLPQAAQGFLKANGATADPAYELVQWGDVQDKPSTYPPEGHTHGAGDIDSGRLDLARLPTSTTANRFLKVGTASTTPAYSTVSWDDVQSKPSTYTPAGHKHDAGDIDSGTLPVARGGTGLSTLTANSFLRGNGTGSVSMRTPAQVRADIGTVAAKDQAGVTTITLTGNPGYTLPFGLWLVKCATHPFKVTVRTGSDSWNSDIDSDSRSSGNWHVIASDGYTRLQIASGTAAATAKEIIGY